MTRRAELVGIVRPEVDDRDLERQADKMEEKFSRAANISANIDTRAIQRKLERAIPGGSLLGTAADAVRGSSDRASTAGQGGGGGLDAAGSGTALTIQKQMLDELEDIHTVLQQGGGGGGGGGGNGLPTVIPTPRSPGGPGLGLPSLFSIAKGGAPTALLSQFFGSRTVGPGSKGPGYSEGPLETGVEDLLQSMFGEPSQTNQQPEDISGLPDNVSSFLSGLMSPGPSNVPTTGTTGPVSTPGSDGSTERGNGVSPPPRTGPGDSAMTVTPTGLEFMRGNGRSAPARTGPGDFARPLNRLSRSPSGGRIDDVRERFGASPGPTGLTASPSGGQLQDIRDRFGASQQGGGSTSFVEAAREGVTGSSDGQSGGRAQVDATINLGDLRIEGQAVRQELEAALDEKKPRIVEELLRQLPGELGGGGF